MIDLTLIISLVVAAVIIFILGWGVSWFSDKLRTIEYLKEECRSLQRQIYKKQDRI